MVDWGFDSQFCSNGFKKKRLKLLITFKNLLFTYFAIFIYHGY